MFWATVIFAIALSLDGFGVGISYGMRKIRIPWLSLIVICISSTSALAISMLAGNFIASFISTQLAGIIGGLALLIVGVWLLFQAWIQKLEKKNKDINNVKETFTIFKFAIPSLGVVIKILKEPAQADFDGSGEITINEAVFLGFALAMDALGAGLGAAMMGFNPVISPIVVGFCKFCLVSLGLYLGSKPQINKILGDLALLPGIIIICMGFLKVFNF